MWGYLNFYTKLENIQAVEKFNMNDHNLNCNPKEIKKLYENIQADTIHFGATTNISTKRRTSNSDTTTSQFNTYHQWTSTM